MRIQAKCDKCRSSLITADVNATHEDLCMYAQTVSCKDHAVTLVILQDSEIAAVPALSTYAVIDNEVVQYVIRASSVPVLRQVARHPLQITPIDGMNPMPKTGWVRDNGTFVAVNRVDEVVTEAGELILDPSNDPTPAPEVLSLWARVKARLGWG